MVKASAVVLSIEQLLGWIRYVSTHSTTDRKEYREGCLLIDVKLLACEMYKMSDLAEFSDNF